MLERAKAAATAIISTPRVPSLASNARPARAGLVSMPQVSAHRARPTFARHARLANTLSQPLVQVQFLKS